MLTVERLKLALDYSPETGIFKWKIDRRGNIKSGCVAGCKRINGYTTIKIDGTHYNAHRLAWLYVHGHLPDGVIDHANGDRNDNRINNLRDVSQQKNTWNKKKPKNNTSGVKGVYWNKRNKKFIAAIELDGKQIVIGRFDDISSAEIAIKNARNKIHGKYAKHI